MSFKGTRHGNGVADVAVAKLLRLWGTGQHYDVTRFEYVLWRRIIHEWVMNIHYQTWIAQGRFQNMIHTPSKQWGVCDNISTCIWMYAWNSIVEIRSTFYSPFVSLMMWNHMYVPKLKFCYHSHCSQSQVLRDRFDDCNQPRISVPGAVRCIRTVKPVYNDHLMGYFSAFWCSWAPEGINS